MNLLDILLQNDRAFNKLGKKNAPKVSATELSETQSPRNNKQIQQPDLSLESNHPNSINTSINDDEYIDISTQSSQHFYNQNSNKYDEIYPTQTLISAIDISDEIERLSRSYSQDMDSWIRNSSF